MKALLLAGGSASRLFPFTSTRPKPLIPIANRTIIHHNLELLAKAGVSSVVVVHDKGSSAIQDSLNTMDSFGMQIEYAAQEEPGIGNAMLAARNRFVQGQYFLLVYADILTNENIFNHMLGTFHRLRSPVAAVSLTDDPVELYGSVYLEEELKIKRIEEKPRGLDHGSYILAGAYVIPSSIFDMLGESGGDMVDALHRLIEKDGLTASIWDREWFDINYPWSILHANRMVLNTMRASFIAADVKIPNSVSIDGPVHIESGTVICEGAVIRGPVIIGRDCFIGNNALIRENCSMGDGSEIGFGTELKNAIIFGNAIIGRISYLGDSVVGYNAHIGSGTMTVNYPVNENEVHVPVKGKLINTGLRKLGAFIGDNVNIGASNTIAAGAVIESGGAIADNFTVNKDRS